jgi:hypothetical protein
MEDIALILTILQNSKPASLWEKLGAILALLSPKTGKKR